MDEMEATPEQKKELTVKAIGIAGFERVGDMDVYTQEHGLMKIVVDLTNAHGTAKLPIVDIDNRMVVT